MKRLNPVCLLSLVILAATSQAAAPARNVQGHNVYSSHDPAVRIDLPASATYAGADHWILQASADDIEMHVFVDTDKVKGVQRLYWLQFEAILPSSPDLRMTYDSPRHATLGGMDFFIETGVTSTRSKHAPESDSAHFYALLAAKGYTVSDSLMSVRFVHLMDSGRKELMFIYAEPTPTGLTADDLKKGGKAYGKRADLEKGLIERGEKSIQFHLVGGCMRTREDCSI